MNIKILPYERMEYNDNEIGIDNVSIKYIQQADCTEDKDNVQTITLSTRNNGFSRFINIQTENWSISDINELKKIISDFEKRAGI